MMTQNTPNSKTKSNIKLGDYIVIQRQRFTKLHKFNSLDSSSTLGKDQLLLKNINNVPYFSTFKMVLKGKASKRVFILEPCADIKDLKETLGERESGLDNRHIQDDGQSQQLSTKDITNLKDSDLSSSEIVSHIVDNSKTFASKTEYSQEKYLKKKEKKYFEYVEIRKPTLRLISEIFYRQDPSKILGLRIDMLAQILCFANVNCDDNFLLYESGTNGLLPAAVMNSIGHNTPGVLVHMHPGNIAQKQGLLALNFPDEQADRCVSVNIYSALRQYYQGEKKIVEEIVELKKRKLENDDDDSEVSPAKISKSDSEEVADSCEVTSPVVEESCAVTDVVTTNLKLEYDGRHKWIHENSRACSYLKKGMNSLIICGKEHPDSIVKALLPFVNNSSPVVIFSVNREPLMSLYCDFKYNGSVTGLKIVNTWMRNYQVLPNRTHPEVNMAASSGYLLMGWVVQ